MQSIPPAKEPCMTLAVGPMNGNRDDGVPVQRQPRQDWPAELTSTLVLPAHPTSIRLGRHVVLAWLQFAHHRYDMDTVLLLVTELLANAVEYSAGPLLLAVCAGADQLHVEVKAVSPVHGRVRIAVAARIADEARGLQMSPGLADALG